MQVLYVYITKENEFILVNICEENTGKEMRRARARVADDDEIHVQRLDVERGVLERFALGNAAGRFRDAHHIRAEPLGRQLKRCARPRARFEEQVDDRLALERGHLLLPFAVL